MAEVFISYSQKDRARVAPIAARLAELGIDAWYDREISAGESFGAIIRAKLRMAKAVLVCWSPEAIDSDWVDAEAEYARGVGTYVPVFVAPCTLLPPYNRIHTADLSKWTGEANDPAWIKLVERVARLIGRADVTSAAGSAGKGPKPDPISRIEQTSPGVAEDAVKTHEPYEKAAELASATKGSIAYPQDSNAGERKIHAASVAGWRSLPIAIAVAGLLIIGLFAVRSLNTTRTPEVPPVAPPPISGAEKQNGGPGWFVVLTMTFESRNMAEASLTEFNQSCANYKSDSRVLSSEETEYPSRGWTAALGPYSNETLAQQTVDAVRQCGWVAAYRVRAKRP